MELIQEWGTDLRQSRSDAGMAIEQALDSYKRFSMRSSRFPGINIGVKREDFAHALCPMTSEEIGNNGQGQASYQALGSLDERDFRVLLEYFQRQNYSCTRADL